MLRLWHIANADGFGLDEWIILAVDQREGGELELDKSLVNKLQKSINVESIL